MQDYRYLILDLDNTLYSKQTGMLAYIDRRIDEYMKQTLKMPRLKVDQLRLDYWRKYGTTLGGLIVHHQIDPDDYFNHAYGIEVRDFVKPDPGLAEMLAKLKLNKLVFSNSPQNYVVKVLEALGIAELFQGIYDIKFCDYLGKPSSSSYQKVLAGLGTTGDHCIMVDDVWVNVIGARQSGMTPVWLNVEQSVELTGLSQDGENELIISEIYQLEKVIAPLTEGRETRALKKSII